MRNLLLAISAFLLTTNFVRAQNKDSQIEFETDVYDFGDIHEEEGKVSHIFEFKNTGEGDLILYSVKASCGCTTPEWPSDPIKPGKKGEIKVTFDPLGRPGRFQKTISIIANTPRRHQVLAIEGNVLKRQKTVEEVFPVANGSLRLKNYNIIFDTVYNNDDDDTAYLVVYQQGSEPLYINEIKTPDHIWNDDEMPLALDPGKAYRILFHFSPKARLSTKKEYGYVFDKVEINTSDKQAPIKNFYAVANILPYVPKLTPEQMAQAAKIDFESNLLDFGKVTEGKVIQTKFKFTNTGKSDLHIFDVSTTCGCTVSNPDKNVLKPGESSYLNVTFNTSGKPGRQSKTVTIFSNDPTKSVSHVTVKGIVAKKNVEELKKNFR